MKGVKNRHGGLIDFHTPLEFCFNGHAMYGYKGDTLASALLANGQKLVGRSFKYHRPRGIFSAGSEEPNALVQLRNGAHTEPNTRATVIELFDGLEAHSQNHRLSLEFDLMAVFDFLSPFLAAGFYYKTFMWPKVFWEKLYEPFIRASAGLGKLSMLTDPDQYDRGYLHCDLLIVGGGPTGLAAALAAGRAGARVILADEDFRLGGRLNFEQLTVDNMTGSEWAHASVAELADMDNVRLMKRTTVFGAYDHGIFGALERKTDHRKEVGKGKPRQIYWRVHAKRSLISTGATERGIAFPDNDRPNIMLAGAARGYLNRFGAPPGKRVAIFTNNDSGYLTANDFNTAGLEVAAVIDTRSSSEATIAASIEVEFNGRIIGTKGHHGIRSVKSLGNRHHVDCLAVSGGWSPNVHLTCHHGNRPVWNRFIAAFVPGDNLVGGMAVAGAANGSLALTDCLNEGFSASVAAVENLGFAPSSSQPAPEANEEKSGVKAFWHVREGHKRAWLDLQNDVTVKDVELAQREGFQSVEHLKRYTTLGMATDQGRTSNIPAIAVMASLTGRTIEATGTTVYRPPYNPVAIGALAGRSRGKEFRPVRRIPSYEWSKQNGAVFVEAGNWLRPQWFQREGENHWRESVDREVVATRNSAGICDVSTLGKIDIQGRDANKFLNLVYANGFKTLAVGRVRYGLMLREDGFVYDDGTTARLGNNHYLMTTTTANAALVFRQLEFARQCLWPTLDVHLISVTDGWAQFAVAGPKSRQLIQKIMDPEHDLSNQAFPYMACGNYTICGGIKARLFRISFSGELAFEIAVATRYGNSMMTTLMAAGEAFGATPYGTEALNVMRIEKGHAAGNELNGQTTAHHLGLGRMVSKKKDCIGNVLAQREGMVQDDDFRMMGFLPIDRQTEFSAGAHFFAADAEMSLENSEGWVSSVAFSPTLGHSIGLGFIKNGHNRLGSIVIAADPVRGKQTEVEIVSPHFIDPEGERLRG